MFTKDYNVSRSDGVLIGNSKQLKELQVDSDGQTGISSLSALNEMKEGNG